MTTAIKEIPAVATIRTVISRFVRASRAFSSKSRVRDGRVARSGSGFVVLLPDGRWTVEGEGVEEPIAYKPYIDFRAARWNHGRRVTRPEVDSYLNALAELGVVEMDDVRAFRRWKNRVVTRRYDKERVVQLSKELAKLKAEISKPVAE